MRLSCAKCIGTERRNWLRIESSHWALPLLRPVWWMSPNCLTPSTGRNSVLRHPGRHARVRGASRHAIGGGSMREKIMVCAIALAFVGAHLRAQNAIDIRYEKFVLENGLTVIVHEDHKAAVVSVD